MLRGNAVVDGIRIQDQRLEWRLEAAGKLLKEHLVQEPSGLAAGPVGATRRRAVPSTTGSRRAGPGSFEPVATEEPNMPSRPVERSAL